MEIGATPKSVVLKNTDWLPALLPDCEENTSDPGVGTSTGLGVTDSVTVTFCVPPAVVMAMLPVYVPCPRPVGSIKAVGELAGSGREVPLLGESCSQVPVLEVVIVDDQPPAGPVMTIFGRAMKF